jgi:23S rRNA (cytidine2498-2'-O)-methyltransferase
MSTLDVYVAAPVVLDVLRQELASLRRGARLVDVAPGIVGAPAGPLVDPAFARQVLPAAVELQGKDASELALRVVAAHGGPFSRVDVLLPELPRRGSAEPGRHPLAAHAATLREELVGKIDGRGLRADDGLVLQVLVVAKDRAWSSAVKPSAAPPLLAWPAAFAGGVAPIEPDRWAPSTAYRKLEEALRWLDDEPTPGDLCVDLGAAPGGWTHALVKRGARVVAVDRAELDPALEKNPLVTHVKKDAFAWIPDEKPTWLCCDVIALPARALKLVEDALSSPKLRALVVTVKLKKPYDLQAVARARAIARGKPGFWGRCKHLSANKLECTLMMKRVP